MNRKTHHGAFFFAPSFARSIFPALIAAGLAVPHSAYADEQVALAAVEREIVGNTGEASVIVHGKAFDTETTFNAISPDGTRIPATRTQVLGYDRAIVTFNMTNAAPGQAQVQASKAGRTATLPKAFLVAAGKSGELKFGLSVPARAKAGETSTIVVNYRNDGFTDIDLPVMVLHVPGAQFLGRSPEGKNYGEYAAVLGVPQAPVYPKLRPGESVNIPFFAKLQGAASTEAKLFAAAPTTAGLAGRSFDYQSLLNGVPHEQQAAVQAKIEDLRRENGSNVGEYYQRQIANISDLASRDAHLRYSNVYNIDGRWEFESPSASLSTFHYPPDNLPAPLDRAAPALQGSPREPPSGGDGVKRNWVVILSAGDYGGVTRARMDLPGANLSGCMVYDYFNLGAGVPKEQIVWLNDRKRDNYSLSPLDASDAIRGLRGKADADDNIVVWYNGHGEVSSWHLPGGDYTPDQLSADLDHVGARGNYVISDSCHAGGFIDQLSAKNTVAFGACEANEYSGEMHHDSAGIAGGRFAYTTGDREDIGGIFSYLMLKHLRRGDSLEDSFKASAKESGAMVTKFFGTHIQTASTNLQNNDFGFCPIDAGEPFGGAANLYRQVTDDTFDSITEGLLGDAPFSEGLIRLQGPPGASFIPGGLAVCPGKQRFFVSDNSGGRIVMISPAETTHRYITVLEGLVAPGDIDIGRNAQSLVYTTDDRVKSQFFGFSAFIADTAGAPLGGADVIVESAAGKFTKRVDLNGYLNVFGLLAPKIASRRVQITVSKENKSHSFSFELEPSCQTLHSLVFNGTGVIEDVAMPDTVPPDLPPPPAAPVPPVAVPITPGKTAIVPPWILDPEEPRESAVGARTIIIHTPADDLITADASQVLSGSVSDPAITQVTCFVDGVSQVLPVVSGSFSSNITLPQGVSSIYCREINSSGVQAESEPVDVTLDPGFNSATGALAGTVLNGATYGGQAGVKVRETQSGRETQTNSQGYYSFAGVPAGAAEVEILWE